MEDPWSNAWSDPADLTAPSKYSASATWDAEQRAQRATTEDDEADIAVPSWATGAGINWNEPSQDSHSSLWSQVPPTASWSPPHSFSDIQLSKAPDTESNKDPSRPTTPDDAPVNSSAPASPISAQEDNTVEHPEEVVEQSPVIPSSSRSPLPTSSPNPDAFGTFEDGTTNDLDPWPHTASPFDTQEDAQDAWGSAWEEKVEKDDAVEDREESVDEWEAAKRMKQEMDRRVPPELLANMLKQADEVSVEAWPEPNDLPEEPEWMQRWQTSWDSVENLDAIRSRYLPEMTLPPLQPFPQSSIGKATINAVKLTRNIALCKSSPMTHFMASRGSTAWEASVKSRVEVVHDEIPTGWRIVEKEKEEKVEEKPKKSGGLLANLWNKRASSIPRQDSKLGQDTFSKAESPTATARSSIDSTRSISTSGIASPSKVMSPTTATTSPTSSSNASQATSSTKSQSIPSYADSGLPSSDSFSPSQDKASDASPNPSAVTRFFSRFSRQTSSSSPRNSMMLSGDDIEFLSDLVPSATDGDDEDDHLGRNDPQLKGLENMLASKPIGGKLPAPLPPPPPAPSRTASGTQRQASGSNAWPGGPASLSFDVAVPNQAPSSTTSPTTSPPPWLPSQASTITPSIPLPRFTTSVPSSENPMTSPRHSSRQNSRSSLSSMFTSPTAEYTSHTTQPFGVPMIPSRPVSAASLTPSVVPGMTASPFTSLPHSRAQSPATFPFPPTATTSSAQSSTPSALSGAPNAPTLPSKLAFVSQPSASPKPVLDDGDDDFGDFGDSNSSSQPPLVLPSATFDDGAFGPSASTAKPTQTSFTFPAPSASSAEFSSHASKPSNTSLSSSSSAAAWFGRPHADSTASNNTDFTSHKSLDSFDDEFSSFMGTTRRPKSPPQPSPPVSISRSTAQPSKPMIALIPLGQSLRRPPSASSSFSRSPTTRSQTPMGALNRARSPVTPLSSQTPPPPIDIIGLSDPSSSYSPPTDPDDSDIIHGVPISASSSFSSQTLSAGKKLSRTENHKRTTSLMELAASRPQRWPAPASPLPEILSPPPSGSGDQLVETDLLGDDDAPSTQIGIRTIQSSMFAGMQQSASQSTGLGLLSETDMGPGLGETVMTSYGSADLNRMTPSISPPPIPPSKSPIPHAPFIPAPPLLPPPPPPGSGPSLGSSAGGLTVPVSRGRPAVATHGNGASLPRTPTLSPDSTPLAMLIPGGGENDGAGGLGGGLGEPTHSSSFDLWGGEEIVNVKVAPPSAPATTMVPSIPMPPRNLGLKAVSMVRAASSPAPAPLPTAAVLPPVSTAKGAGGLSAQDLSFFEGL